MTMFSDAMEVVGGVRETRDGYLVADCAVARTGVQTYAGKEVGRPDMANVRVWRSPDEVFNADSMASFAHRTITLGHPVESGKLVDVRATNWRRHAVGMSGGEVAVDGNRIRVPLMLADSAVISAYRAGKRELSAGYDSDLDWTPGTTPEGEAFDCRQTNIRINHIAVVARGRAGSSCRIGDGLDEQENSRMATIKIGDAEHEVDEAVLAHVATLAAAADEASTRVEVRDGELTALRATHDAEVADLRRQVPDAAALDTMLAGRTRTVDTARRLVADADTAGKTEADIRRLVVTAKLGDAAAGKSDAFVEAAFETLALVAPATSGKDPIRDALRTQAPPANTSDAYAAHVASLATRWKE